MILLQWGHTGPHTSWLSSTGTWVLPFVPKSVCAEALSWSHHPEVSLGQECGTGSMHVPTVSKQTRRTCVEPWLRGVRQAGSAFHSKECGAPLAMSARATPTGHVWNGDTGGTGCVLATSSAQKAARRWSHPYLGWLFYLARWLGGSLRATKLQAASPRPGWNSISPKLEEPCNGSPHWASRGSARCSSFSFELSFIRTKTAGWMSK